uniref:CSON007992 protein n=1 Tax=Culicoides sonorensis TaxID=179676 RepID=A0A336MUZ3_CULSO
MDLRLIHFISYAVFLTTIFPSPVYMDSLSCPFMRIQSDTTPNNSGNIIQKTHIYMIKMITCSSSTK